MEKLRNLKYFSKVPNIHALMNQKHVKCNQPPFKNKQLGKAIMTRTRFLNKYGKYNNARNLFACKRQRNVFVRLLRKSKEDFYNNLHGKRISDKRKFLQTIKPKFTEKTLKGKRITLSDKDKIVTEEFKMANLILI